MSKKVKKKLCWNCEGSAAFEDEHCAFCGVYLSPLSIPGNNVQGDLFSPPYRTEENDTEDEIPPAPFAPTPLDEQVAAVEKKQTPQKELKDANHWLNPTLSCMLYLGAGTVFLLFGLALLLFSDRGVLTLKWDGDFWFLYLLFSLPLLYFGWRSLQEIKEDVL